MLRPSSKSEIRWLFILGALSTVSLFASGPIKKFTKMTSNETLYVKVYGQGCFGSSTNKYIFHFSTQPFVIITTNDPYLSKDRKSVISRKKPKTLGTIYLTSNDLIGLDKLIAFYRSKPKSGCTTVDTIDIIQRSNNEITAKEHFIDGSCATIGLSKDKGLVTFGDLVERIPIKQRFEEVE